MKRIVVGLLSVFFSVGLLAQKPGVQGVVVNPHGKPVAHAYVYSLRSRTSTLTDYEGRFTLNVKDTPDSVFVSCIGYKELAMLATSPAMDFGVCRMQEDGVKIDPVVVKGVPTPMSYSQTVVAKQELESKSLVQDIPFLLEQTPSVVATSEGGTGVGYTNMRIRGTDMTRINVTMNGIPINDAESHGVYWVNMGDFASSVESVSIQRGVGTSTNGTASFGGSVDFETHSPSDRFYAQISGLAGSFGTFRESAAIGTGLIDSCLAFEARVSNISSDGWVERGHSHLQSLDFVGAFVKGNHELKATVFAGRQRVGITWNGLPADSLGVNNRYNSAGEYYDSLGNLRHYPDETDNYWQEHYILSYKWTPSQKFAFDCSLFATKGKGYYEQYKDDAKLWNYGYAPHVKRDLVREKWMDNIHYGYVANATYKKNRLEAILGHGFNIYDGDHFGFVTWVEDGDTLDISHPYYENNGRKSDVNLFAKLLYDITPKLNAYIDGQFRHIDYKMRGTDDDLSDMDHTFKWSFFNPKAGVAYKFSKNHSASLSYAMASREPTRSNLKDAAKAADAVALKPERLNDFELGYRFANRKVLASVNLYYMYYKDQLVQTGKLNETGDDILENVASSFRRGVELTADYRPVRWLEWGGNITLSQNKIRDYVEYATDYDEDWNEVQKVTEHGTTDISYSPNVVAAHKVMFYPAKNLSCGLVSKYVGKQYFDNTSDEVRKLDAYTVHDFKAAYTWFFKNGHSNFNLQLNVNNILNKVYISNAYGGNWYEQGEEKSWMYYFPQAGTNFTVKGTLTF